MDQRGSGLDLALDLPAGPGRRAALEAALRDAIRSGRLRAGTVLPSSRALAADLRVARGPSPRRTSSWSRRAGSSPVPARRRRWHPVGRSTPSPCPNRQVRAIRRRGARTVAVEDPSHPHYRQALADAGFEVLPVPVDEHGLCVDRIPSHVDAVFVTPGHLFPLGVTLSDERRRELVAYAAEHGALVVEDDYFGELRYDGPSLMALQPLAPEHVIHANSVGKSLTPELRLGWLVVPPALRADLVGAKRVADKGTSALEQVTFSDMLASGAYGRHVRRQRTRYRKRRDHLVAALERYVPRARIHTPAAGLYVLVELPAEAADEQEVIADAGRQGIRLISVRDSWALRPAPNLLAIGFAAPPDHDFREAVERLTALLARHTAVTPE